MNGSNGNGIELAKAPEAGQLARQDFGGSSIQSIAETATGAAAAQAQAAVQARYIMALRKPRDVDQVRLVLLKECSRPGFAAVARYHKPIGQGVEGPSIRFAEAAIRAMTNVYPETMAIYDDRSKRIVRVSVTDLESNVTYSKDVTVTKTVERKNLKPGQECIRERTNSYGAKVFIVEATDDEILNAENALTSKALRGLALRLLPGDILEECMAKVVATMANGAAKDPDAARKLLADSFAGIGVSPADLKAYLGHDLATLAPAELVQLRSLFCAIRDGEGTWAEAMEARTGKAAAPAVQPPPAPSAPASAPAAQTSAAPAAEPAAQQGPPLKLVEPPDELTKEIEAIAAAIKAATTRMALQPLASRITKLPEQDRKPLMDAYKAAAGVLP